MKSQIAKLLETMVGRSPRGERGLKWSRCCQHVPRCGRSPRGERGLKLNALETVAEMEVVAPLAGSVD